MSERDLIQELKSTIKDFADEKDDLLKTIKQKEARIKTVMIKLEHATQDVQSVGHKIEDQNKEIAKLKAKLETKEKLLEEALTKIKDIYADSTKKDTNTDTDNPKVDS
jgi:septal ring factor EnvC (AmiA/AmiB activator)